MENVRLILLMALVFIVLMIYQAWQEDYGPKPPTQSQDTPTAVTSEQPTVPAETPVVATPTPDTPADVPQPVDAATPVLPTMEGGSRLLPSDGRVIVETDVLKVELDKRGGDIRGVDLLDYTLSVDNPEPMRLMNDTLPHIFVLQTGLLPGSQTQKAPSHQSIFQTAKSSYKLSDGQDELNVELIWQDESGLSVSKIYQFARGSHTIQVRHVINNNTGQDWVGRVYGQLQRTQITEEQSAFIYTYMGGAISSPSTRYEKISFDEIADGGTNGNIAPDGTITTDPQAGWNNGWAAMLQHYFVAALIPVKDQPFSYYTKHLSNGHRYVVGMYGPAVTATAGQSQTVELTFYAGPKIQETLESISPSLELTVDYGFLWMLAKPLFLLLEFIHDFIGNWGFAIILVTILIKLAFYKLSETSYKSMAHMRQVQPRLMALRERYADDRAGLNQAMMDMYRKEKINPLGGCLPIVVQIPVFIALYWVLLESVELRQAPFILWINDLAQPDPFFVLPLIMGATMLVQQKLNPAPVDPVQQKVMMAMPIVFTVFFAFFPSGLVLYWVVNNALSIAQQWYITKQIEAQAAAKAK